MRDIYSLLYEGTGKLYSKRVSNGSFLFAKGEKHGTGVLDLERREVGAGISR